MDGGYYRAGAALAPLTAMRRICRHTTRKSEGPTPAMARAFRGAFLDYFLDYYAWTGPGRAVAF